MRISYCTTCHKRLWQLKQTLIHNLKFIQSGFSELIILLYNDNESYHYLVDNFNNYIKDGRLVLINYLEKEQIFEDGTNWSCGYVKHLVHSYASGEVLFNLDADNFIDIELNSKLNTLLPTELLLITHNKWLPDGRSGRIGVHRDMYNNIQGYRDKGRNDDGDFVSQCKIKGCKIVYADCPIKPISNDISLSLDYL